MRFSAQLDYYKTKVGLSKLKILDIVQKHGYNGVVFDMDGRLYTTVLAALAKEAIGNHVKALIMPHGLYSNHDDMCDAIDIASSFQIQYRIQDITIIHQEINRGHTRVSSPDRVNELIRITCLYNEADRLNFAVLGLNKEFGNMYNGLPMEGLLPEEIEGMASLLGVPDHIILK